MTDTAVCTNSFLRLPPARQCHVSALPHHSPDSCRDPPAQSPTKPVAALVTADWASQSPSAGPTPPAPLGSVPWAPVTPPSSSSSCGPCPGYLLSLLQDWCGPGSVPGCPSFSCYSLPGADTPRASITDFQSVLCLVLLLRCFSSCCWVWIFNTYVVFLPGISETSQSQNPETELPPFPQHA